MLQDITLRRSVRCCLYAAAWAFATTQSSSQQPAWRDAADTVIGEVRKREVCIRVVDGQEQALPAVQVEIVQTKKSFPFGAALSPAVLHDEQYKKFFLTHFNWAVFENEMKWYSTEARRGREHYATADAMVQWCQSNGIPLRGHCIFWEPGKWQPQWLRTLDADAVRESVERRCESIVGHYRGHVRHWDVNNEMLHGSFFRDKLGQDIHAWMFKHAHETDPDAKLFVNEFNILSVDKDFETTQVDEYVEQVRNLIAEGAPIHGVGIQGHIWSAEAVEHPEAIRDNLDRVAELGLPIWITEFDSAFDTEALNADALEAVYRTAYGHPAVEGIIMWVTWSGNSWRGPNAGIAQDDWSLNATGERYESLMAEWSTKISGQTDANGELSFRGFHGEYTVRIRRETAKTVEKTIQVPAGEEALCLTITVPTE
ncbi:Endo-1,4-beta-xylanase A precursor [Posidoniimonas polymericola]|uniref:Beta-xylanase n=1 Tax=Posidoniimonas polymericola TaxID=2528002 RepID=A0A5C5XV00_9BACT|nr:endo-1,4-beta-xylanase [Posidoniimonas polymericola]TWT66223.1 Endo-1,4-beta-xylanase A precursor [Posidoniimonas polymericola]